MIKEIILSVISLATGFLGGFYYERITKINDHIEEKYNDLIGAEYDAEYDDKLDDKLDDKYEDLFFE